MDSPWAASPTSVITLARLTQAALGLMILAIYLPAVWDLPRIGQALAIVQLLYAVSLLLIPRCWLLVLPLVTVSLDMAPWSGRFLFSEFDGFVAVSLAVPALVGRYRLRALTPTGAQLVLGAYALLYLLNVSEPGAFLMPPGRGDENPYYSSLYSYKVGKGFFWGLLLAWLWISEYLRDRQGTLRDSVIGAVTASGALLVLALWERGTLQAVAEAGAWWDVAHAVLDFSSEYRITGIFADMHTGGEVIDGLMILLLPVVLFPLIRTRDVRISAVYLFAVLALGYCIVIGVTRATWAAAGFAMLTTMAGAHHRKDSGSAIPGGLSWASVVAFAGAVLVARYLYQQGGSDGLMVFGITVAGPFFIAHSKMALRLQLPLLVSGLAVVAGLALRAHLESRYAQPDNVTRVVVPLVTIALGGGLWWLARRSRQQPDGHPLRQAMLLVALPGGLALALGSYSISDRMTGSGNDFQTRVDHWQQVIDSAPSKASQRWFGSGVGTFPRRYIETYPQQLAEIGSFALPGGVTPVLRLGVGGDLAVIQRSPLEPWTEYRAQVRTRSMGTGEVALRFCQQNQLVFNRWGNTCTGGRVRYGRLDNPVDENGFESHEFTFNSGRVAAAPAWQRWPVSLQVVHERGGSPVELAQLSVKGPTGQLLVNGDFRQGLDAWFFQANFKHLPWHIKNLWLQVWYETGYLGLALFLALLAIAAARAVSAPRADPVVRVAFLSVLSVFVVGAFGSPLDSARVSLWFYMLLAIAVLSPPLSSTLKTPQS